MAIRLKSNFGSGQEVDGIDINFWADHVNEDLGVCIRNAN